MSHVKDVSVIVTGGAGGLGKAIAAAYLDAGALVTICDASADRLAETTKEWSSRYPAGRFVAVEVDVTDEASARVPFDTAKRALNRFDVLVNHAGVMEDRGPIVHCRKAQWDQILGLNLMKPFLVSSAAIWDMGQQSFLSLFKKPGRSPFVESAWPYGKGLIINIVSTPVVKDPMLAAAYAASEAAFAALTQHTTEYHSLGTRRVALTLRCMPEPQLVGAPPRWAPVEQSRALQELGRHGMSPAAVGRYCVSLSDREVADGVDGTVVSLCVKWPEA